MENMFPVRQGTMAMTNVDPAAVAAGEAAKARIQSAYIMAMQRPRNEKDSRDRILMACRRPEFAERAEFSKPVGSKKVGNQWVKQFVNGPSIRFAELALREWGNIMSEVQTLFEDEKVRRVRVSVLDLESNSQFTKDLQINKTVERSSCKNREDDVVGTRKNSWGKDVYILSSTEEELYTKEAAWVSKILRNEGLRLIPTDIIEEGIAAARQVVAQNLKQDPQAALKKMLDAFSGLGIKPSDLETNLLAGQSIDTINPAQTDELRKVYASLKSGEATWKDYLQQEENKDSGEGLAELIKEKQAKNAEKAASTLSAEQQTELDNLLSEIDQIPKVHIDAAKEKAGLTGDITHPHMAQKIHDAAHKLMESDQ